MSAVIFLGPAEFGSELCTRRNKHDSKAAPTRTLKLPQALPHEHKIIAMKFAVDLTT